MNKIILQENVQFKRLLLNSSFKIALYCMWLNKHKIKIHLILCQLDNISERDIKVMCK